ncbi:DUF1361 domain-containing protein [Patescibacteria group bacterium]|nr:DUF1361 domain-containing protein [Patescibacteria group bacterium]MBU1683066.1 DUF1361 domain-containing protein [Patescibacteria group bacterium]
MEYILQLDIHGYPLLMIPWNIILALVPCAIVYYLAKGVGKKKWKQLKNDRFAFMLIFLIWLFVLPNTAYLFMIPRHLVNYCDNLSMYRVCLDGSWLVMFFFAYALIGLPTFYYGLNKMVRIFKTMCGDLAAKLLPIFTIPLISIAVMFGLYSRYNSWDVVFRPNCLLKTVASYFSETHLLIDFVVFTLGLYLIYYVTRYAVDASRLRDC